MAILVVVDMALVTVVVGTSGKNVAVVCHIVSWW